MIIALKMVIPICLIISIIYLAVNYLYSYWTRRRIVFIKPWPIVGNLFDIFALRVSFGELFQRFYEHPELQQSDYGGIFLLHRPALIIREPDLIKRLLIKDFDKFLNRFEAADGKNDSMGSLSLPLSKYPIWHICRKKMSEVFTTGRIKNRMYPLMLEIAKELELYILKQYNCILQQNTSIEIEIKEMCSLFTTDLTSILHYGIDVKGLKTGNSVLRQETIELIKINLKKVFNFMIVFFLPQLTALLQVQVFTPTYMNFMRKFTLKIIQQRRYLTSNSVTQGDLLDILQKFQEREGRTHTFSQHPDFIASQVAIFLLAGFETSSSVLSFILYELTKYPCIQERLRLELKQAFAKDEFLTYEKLQSLSYLHQVVCEGLRLYPAAAFINRECTPGRESPKGFYLKSDLFIPRGMPLYVSILGLHRDPKYWPDPNVFRPERFSADNLPNIHPMTYLPFGAGPHGCIGSRLGLLQVKLGLAHILKKCQVQKCSRTQSEIKFDANSFMLQAKGGIYLKFIKDEL